MKYRRENRRPIVFCARNVDEIALRLRKYRKIALLTRGQDTLATNGTSKKNVAPATTTTTAGPTYVYVITLRAVQINIKYDRISYRVYHDRNVNDSVVLVFRSSNSQ